MVVSVPIKVTVALVGGVGVGLGVGVGVGVGAGVGIGVGGTPAEDELESEDCNTFRSAAEVHGPPFASVSARSRMYRYTLDPNEICFSVASLAKLPVASGVHQFNRLFVA